MGSSSPRCSFRYGQLAGRRIVASGCHFNLGAAASLACAVHCAAMPLLLSLLPLVGLSCLAKEQTEWALICLSLGLGSLSLLPSYARKHRRLRPLLLFAFGGSRIITALLSAEEGTRLEAPAMTLGALLIAC